MEFFLDLLFLGFVFSLLFSGSSAEGVGGCLLVMCTLAVYQLVVDCSFFFGVMVCLTYISALLILFLFFVSLAPSSEDISMNFGVVKWGVFGFMSTSGFLCPMVGGGTTEMDSKLSFLLFFFVGEYSFFLVLFGVYLLLVVVMVAKLVNRDMGALRVGVW